MRLEERSRGNGDDSEREAAPRCQRWPRVRGQSFPSSNHLTLAGQPLGRGTLGNLLRRAAHRAGLDRSVSPHQLRHSLHLLRNGAPTLAIKSLLGHEALLTTEVHLEVEVDGLRRMLRRSHSRERG